MNIVHVFPIFSISKGGGTVWLLCELAKHQSKKNKVTILTGSSNIDNKLIQEVKKHGIKVVVYKSYLNKIGFYFMPGLLCDSSVFDDKQIFHLHLYRSFQNLIIILKAKFFKISCVLDAHGSIPTHNIRSLKKHFYDFLFKKFTINNVRFFIAENNLSYNECISLGVPKKKIRIVNPPFPIDEYNNVRNLDLLKNFYGIKEEHIILYFGRFHFIKGIDFLIKSFSELRKRRNDIHLVLMGRDDGFEKDLNKLINELNLNKYVTNIGFKIGKEKNSIIKESNVCVQVSRYEQGAGAPFEAVLIGTPIIVSDHSGSAEDTKRYDAGYFSKFNDKIDLSNKINFILQNPKEAILKTRNASQKIKLNLGIDVVNKNYLKIYFESNI